jgi:zinc protease
MRNTTLVHPGLAPARKALDNGAVLIVKEARTLPAVTVQVAVHAGSLFDPADGLGLAFFVSRLLDRGTSARSAEELAEALDSRGVALTQQVTRHLLTLTCTCLAEDFDAIMDLMGELVREAVFPEEEIAKRRAEIITLLRQDQDNPAVVAMERLMAELYPDPHPYGRPARGTLDSIPRIGRAMLAAFHRDRFAPGSTTVVIVGDVDERHALQAAERALGGWNAPVPPAPALVSPPFNTTRRQIAIPMMNKAQADIAYGFVAIRRADPAYYACWLMNNVLGQYALGGRLGDNIRERQGMAYYVFSALDPNIIEGPLVIRAGVEADHVERAIAAIDEELTRAVGEGFTPQEVADSKQYLIGSLPRMLETNAGIASFLMTAEFFGLGTDYDVRLPGLLDQVHADEVNVAARRLLDPGRAVVVVAGPYEAR